MAWYWIVLLVLAALITLLCLTRVGIRAEFGAEDLHVEAKIGPVSIQLFPPKEKKTKADKKKKAAGKRASSEKKTAAAKKTPDGNSEKKKTKIAFADIKDAVRTLWPPLKRALGKTRRSIRVNPLRLSVTVGAGQDPAAGAKLYGQIHCGVWTGMPVLEQLLDIPNPRIHVGIDFDAPKTAAEGTAGVSIRIGAVLLIVLTVGIPALRWFLRFRKKKQNTTDTALGKHVDGAAA